jgi:CubicO group peptidase (beta-lactamase class C family)
LQVIERGQLHLDDPVSDYVPQFTNLIVVDDVMKEHPSYVPAKETVRIKHLLNFTSGLNYPWTHMVPEKQIKQYSSPHNKEDPIGEFFRQVKASHFVSLPSAVKNLINQCRDPCQASHSSSSLGLIVGCFFRV